MKKFIMNLLGIEATAKNIRGKKSAGYSDIPDFRARKKPGGSGYEDAEN